MIHKCGYWDIDTEVLIIMLILVLAVSFIFLFGIAKEIAKSMDRIEEIQNHMKGGK